MNIAITMIEPTASKAATAAIAATTMSPSEIACTGRPREAAKPSSKVAIFQGPPEDREKRTSRGRRRRRCGKSSGGRPARAVGSRSEGPAGRVEPDEAFEICHRSACSTSRWTSEVSDCSRRRTPAAKSVVKTTPIAAPASMRPSRRDRLDEHDGEKGGPPPRRGASARWRRYR